LDDRDFLSRLNQTVLVLLLSLNEGPSACLNITWPPEKE
jgi:hypothetical protein